jgi:AcrR family transcriptional regulator
MSEESRSGDSRERILRTATRLFAEHGFHGVSTREIAAASSLNISTVNYHVGKKQELYHEVFRRLSVRGEHILNTIKATDSNIANDPAAIKHLIDQLIDALLAESIEFPETRPLWVRLALDDKEEFGKIDAEFGSPYQLALYDILERAYEAGTIKIHGSMLRLGMLGFDGLLDVYFNKCPLEPDGSRGKPLDEQNLADFREFLRNYAHTTLGLE